MKKSGPFFFAGIRDEDTSDLNRISGGGTVMVAGLFAA